MELENRYHVIKISDADKYLSAAEYCTLAMLLEKVSEARKADKKPELSGIFIEQDWPEYLPTFRLLERRVDELEVCPGCNGAAGGYHFINRGIDRKDHSYEWIPCKICCATGSVTLEKLDGFFKEKHNRLVNLLRSAMEENNNG